MKTRTFVTAYALVLTLMTAIACSQLGVEPISRAPHTIEEGLIIASESGKGMTQTFTQLRRSNLVTKEQFDVVIGHLQTAKDTTQSGLNLFRSGSYSSAMTALDKAEMTLHVVAAILAQLELDSSPDNGASTQ